MGVDDDKDRKWSITRQQKDLELLINLGIGPRPLPLTSDPSIALFLPTKARKGCMFRGS